MRQPQANSTTRAALASTAPTVVRTIIEVMTADGTWRPLELDATPTGVVSWRVVREEVYRLPATLQHEGCCVPAGTYTLRHLSKSTPHDGTPVPACVQRVPVNTTIALSHEETERYDPATLTHG